MRMLYEHCPDDGGQGNQSCSNQLQQIGKWGRELSLFNPCPTALPPNASLTEAHAVANMRSHVKAEQRPCSKHFWPERPENFSEDSKVKACRTGSGGAE